jgi:hypothetical protein
MATVQRQVAIEAYYSNPNKCCKCDAVIQVGEQKVAEVRKKKFCNQSCAAAFNNRGIARNPEGPKRQHKEYHCKVCNLVLDTKRRYCDDCRHGRFSEVRYEQLRVEESVAERLRIAGWEIFSPTVVCDRVGIKNGKVFFLEFKPEGKEILRSGQQRVFDCVPDMYRVITHQ